VSKTNKAKMIESSPNKHITEVSSFHDLVTTSFQGEVNALCWKRSLKGDFSEIVEKISFSGNMIEIDEEELMELDLSPQGQLAREVLLQDMRLLTEFGASPSLNIIKHYVSDNENPYFPTDVYSFHVDRSPIPVDTFLCTYFGAASDIVPNAQATQKIRIPEIRQELRKQFQGSDTAFEEFLEENFLDLHYQAHPDAQITNLGLGNLWRLTTDHPELQVPPCIHRAPREKDDEKRLLLIC
jgi:hypothetical protein